MVPQNIADQNAQPVVDKKWSVTQKKSVKGDKNSIIISLSDDADLETGRSTSFGMGCVHNLTVAGFFSAKKFVGEEYTTFEYSIDGQPAERRKWQVSDTGIFVSDQIPFLKSLAGGKKLAVRGYPLIGDVVEMTFDIEGIENVLPLIQNECGWQ